MRKLNPLAAALVLVLGFALSAGGPARATPMVFDLFGTDLGGTASLAGTFTADVTFSGTDKPVLSFSVSEFSTGNIWDDTDIVHSTFFTDAVNPAARVVSLLVEDTVTFDVLILSFPPAPGFGFYGVQDAAGATLAIGIGAFTSPTEVPAPPALALFGLGLALFGLMRRKVQELT